MQFTFMHKAKEQVSICNKAMKNKLFHMYTAHEKLELVEDQVHMHLW